MKMMQIGAGALIVAGLLACSDQGGIDDGTDEACYRAQDARSRCGDNYFGDAEWRFAENDPCAPENRTSSKATYECEEAAWNETTCDNDDEWFAAIAAVNAC